MDFAIVKFFNHIDAPWFTGLSFFVSWIPFIVTFFLVITLWTLLRHRKHARLILLAVFIALTLHFGITEGIFKGMLSAEGSPLRSRPYAAHPSEIRSAGEHFQDSSFPSSHVAASAAILTVLVIFAPELFIPAILFVLLMGISRMANGMHYPSDILAGAIFGTLYGFIAARLARRMLGSSR